MNFDAGTGNGYNCLRRQTNNLASDAIKGHSVGSERSHVDYQSDLRAAPVRPRLNRLIHQIPLVFVAVFAVVGVLLGSCLPDGALFRFWLPALAFTSLAFWLAKSKHSKNWLLAAAICLPLFMARQANFATDYYSGTILSAASEIPQPAILRVQVDRPVVLRRNPLAEIPSRRVLSPWQTQFEARVTELRSGQRYVEASGRVLVVVEGKLTSFRPGDALELYGSLRAFPSPTNPGERDLRPIYQRRQLHARVDVDSPDQIVVIQTPNNLRTTLSPNRWVASFADTSRSLLLQHTTETTGPLAIALVIGQRDFVDSDTRDLLLVTGTAHLLSVSGLHLAIIVMLAKLAAMLVRLPQSLEIGWILSVCVAYVAITGGRPPVMRAALLVAALLIAIWLQRPSQPINTLALAALVLIYWNPMNVSAVGVQLSFLAVATLLLCGRRLRRSSSAPAIDQALEKEERLNQLADSSRTPIVRYGRVGIGMLAQMTWMSACVTATSIPLVWYHFHVVSPISVATNVLLSPLLVFALASGVGTVFLGLISSTLGGMCGTVCSAFLWLMQQIISLAASVPYGHAWLPSPNWYWVAFFYIALAASLYWRQSHRVKWLRRSWIVVWGCIAWWTATTPAELPTGTMEATFIDVGHGTCVVLRLGDESWLYDCGRLGNDTGSSRDIDETLWSLGITELDGVFLSHADSDHYNALPGIVKRFAIREIITPPGMLAENEKGALNAVRTAIAETRIRVREASAGQTLDAGKLPIRILHPPLGGVGGNDNANSLVLSIAKGALLLPGDLEPPGTQSLINQPRPAPGGVLMAPHHGSLTMNAEAVLQWARPRETVVSGGRRARRPEVAQMLATTGSGVHVTATEGAVRVRIDAQGQIEIRTWKQAPW
ncbi:ComEC family competence protein [Planctomycetes bacterium K23_9]|uniref:ComEC family competence protein n=1 Tax=Stieleria marina TaxID=1930275 RepID=A0A517NPD5_9BACT|nr:ComEC family competence protein [Planctomycetes bacterium K23_9]